MDISPAQFKKLMKPLVDLSHGVFSAPLAPDEFFEPLRTAAETVNAVVRYSKELHDFTIMLGKGDLGYDPPTGAKCLSPPIIELHSHLRKLTWQVQQAERGDYNQTVDFMGEFSTSFNKLVKRLSEREQQLKSQIGFNRKSRQALVRSFRAVTGILENLTDKVILVRDNEILFFNGAAGDIVSSYQTAGEHPKTLTFLHYMLLERPIDENVTYSLFDELDSRWYSIHYIRMDWVDGEPADLFVATDITEHKRKEQTLRVAADTDPLTGVGNRSYGVGALHQSMVDSARWPICVCFLDMDGLKYVNDTFGHAEGDYFIKSLAEAIKSSMRKQDIMARMGGDEFLLLFFNAEKHIAQAAVDRIQERLNLARNLNGADYPMTFSCGITVITKNTGKTAEEYIDMADRAMYEDKKRKKRAKGE